MNKIFCGKCKYRRYIDLGGCTGDHCKSIPILMFDPIHHWKREEDCLIKNRNNDCKEYELKKRFFSS